RCPLPPKYTPVPRLPPTANPPRAALRPPLAPLPLLLTLLLVPNTLASHNFSHLRQLRLTESEDNRSAKDRGLYLSTHRAGARRRAEAIGSSPSNRPPSSPSSSAA